MQYQKAGVREYWIVDPFQELVSVMNFEDAAKSGQFSFQEVVSSGVLNGLDIRVSDLLLNF